MRRLPEYLWFRCLMVAFSSNALRGVASDFAVRGDRIVLLDMFADSAIVVFDTAGNLIRRLGARGDGPSEVRNLTHVDIPGDTATLWDAGHRRLYRLVLSEPESELMTVPIPPPSNGVIDRAFARGGGYVGTGLTYEGVYFEWPSADTIGRWRAEQSRILRELPEMRRFMASAAFSTIKPDRTRLAVGHLDTGELLIVDLNEGVVLFENRVGAWPVEWETIDRGGGNVQHRLAAESLLGYARVKEADQSVAALFVGKPRKEAQLQMSFDARDVHIFDWDGNLQAAYRLDRPVTDIEVRGRKLFGLIAEPIPQLVVWTLPKEIPEMAYGGCNGPSSSPVAGIEDDQD